VLLLFDIDGTLLLTERAGVQAMQAAGRALYGERFSLEKVDLAGRLDPHIWRDGLAQIGLEPSEELHASFQSAYERALEERLRARPTARALPGVLALLEHLRGLDDTTLGLVTGNYAATGSLKLRAAGIDPAWFPVAAWGGDGAHRRELPPVAMRRFAERAGRAIAAEHVVVIGDTPSDVDCARANGCRGVAVATGPSFSSAELRAHEPDLLLEDLSDSATLLTWLQDVRASART
jgi:phosphoglycolate phosphatase-like HAD superfamily hydrolase